MAGYIEDRWKNKRTGERTPLWGKGKRYKVAGIPGVRARSFDAAKNAKNWLATAQTDSGRQEFVDPRSGAITLTNYIDEHWLPGVHGAPNTVNAVKTYIKHIEDVLGSVPLADIDATKVRAAIKTLTDRSLASSYVARIMRTFSSILETAIDDKRLMHNPMRARTVVIPTVGRAQHEAWTADRVLRVREEISSRYRLAVALGVGCGLRKGEVFGLSEEDVDTASGIIHVRRQIQRVGGSRYYRPPKGNVTRTVDMPDSVAEAVRLHLTQFPAVMVEMPWGRPDATKSQAHRLIFTTVRKHAVHMSSWDVEVWKPALAKASVIPPLKSGEERWKYQSSRKNGFHVLRHTYASLQLEAGESVVTLAKWLGHSSPTITLDHYAHFIPGAGAKGRAAVDSLLL